MVLIDRPGGNRERGETMKNKINGVTMTHVVDPSSGKIYPLASDNAIRERGEMVQCTAITIDIYPAGPFGASERRVTRPIYLMVPVRCLFPSEEEAIAGAAAIIEESQTD